MIPIKVEQYQFQLVLEKSQIIGYKIVKKDTKFNF